MRIQWKHLQITIILCWNFRRKRNCRKSRQMFLSEPSYRPVSLPQSFRLGQSLKITILKKKQKNNNPKTINIGRPAMWTTTLELFPDYQTKHDWKITRTMAQPLSHLLTFYRKPKHLLVLRCRNQAATSTGADPHVWFPLCVGAQLILTDPPTPTPTNRHPHLLLCDSMGVDLRANRSATTLVLLRITAEVKGHLVLLIR